MAYLLVLGSVFLGGLAQVLMKIGTSKIQLTLFNILTNPYILSGLSFYALSAILWIYALSKFQLSQAYPMVSLGYVLVFVLSYFVLHEPISILRVCGLLTIITGVIIVANS